MNFPPPPAPMPPFDDHGPFPGVPMGQPGPPPGAIPVGGPIPVHNFNNHNQFHDDRDWPRGNRDNDDSDDDHDERGGNKANKNNKNKKNQAKTRIDIKFECYVLTKAAPEQSGTSRSWARVNKQALHLEHKKLIEIVQAHRKRTGTTPDYDFKKLNEKQQGILNHLIAERKLNEKNKNADWVLVDVQRQYKGWSKSDANVTSLQVILKRCDKNQDQTKKGDYRGRSDSKALQFGEILDLSYPPEKKKAGNKKNNKNKNSDDDDHFDGHHGNFGHDNFGGFAPPPPNHFAIPPNNFGPPPMPPPPGPMYGNGPEPFGHGPMPMPPPPDNFNPRHSFNGGNNPFQPNPEFGPFDPVQFDEQDADFQRQRSRSRSQRRRSATRLPSARRPSVGERRFSELEDRVDELDDLNRRLKRNMRLGSSVGTYDEDSVFTRSDEQDWTPPSSPRSQFSNPNGRGSLSRRNSSSRNPKYHRSHRYSDTDYQPERASRDDRRYSPRRRRSTRTHMHDDYPEGQAVQRYRTQRRQEDYFGPWDRNDRNDRDRFERNGRYDDDYENDGRVSPRDTRDRRRPSRNFDGFRDGYESGRRNSYYN